MDVKDEVSAASTVDSCGQQFTCTDSDVMRGTTESDIRVKNILTHWLTAARDQLRVVVTSTVTDPWLWSELSSQVVQGPLQLDTDCRPIIGASLHSSDFPLMQCAICANNKFLILSHLMAHVRRRQFKLPYLCDVSKKQFSFCRICHFMTVTVYV